MNEISDNLDTARERLKAQAESSPNYLTVEEAASMARCNPMTIRRAFKAGVLTAFRPAHRVLLRETDVRDWIESRPATMPAPPSRLPRSPRQRSGNGGPEPGSAADLRAIERSLTR